jgi:hypothetical protein
MIDSADLAAMISQMNDTHAGTLVLYRRSKAGDGEGGFTLSYAPVAGGTVAYRIVQLTGLERAFAQRFGTVTTWTLGVPLTPEVLPSDRYYSGTVPVYEVSSGNLPRSIALEQLVQVVKI